MIRDYTYNKWENFQEGFADGKKSLKEWWYDHVKKYITGIEMECKCVENVWNDKEQWDRI